MALLPEGSAIAKMLSGYTGMREQTRACHFWSSGPQPHRQKSYGIGPPLLDQEISLPSITWLLNVRIPPAAQD